MRKLAFCICENKDADQLRGNREADQRLCFRYIDSTISLQNFKPLAIFCGCTARDVSDLVGNPEDRFSHNEAHLCILQHHGTSVLGLRCLSLYQKMGCQSAKLQYIFSDFEFPNMVIDKAVLAGTMSVYVPNMLYGPSSTY